MCEKIHEVKITKLYPPIRIMGGNEKRRTIRLTLPVTCEAKKVVRPFDVESALELLDASLPLDFKVAIVQGEYINPYFYGPYGASVEDDLDEFYSDRWALSDSSSICKNLVSKDEEFGGCFYTLLNILREKYRLKVKE